MLHLTPAEIVWLRATKARDEAIARGWRHRVERLKEPVVTGAENEPEDVPEGELPWE